MRLLRGLFLVMIPVCLSFYACCPTSGDGSTGAAGSAGKKNAPVTQTDATRT